MIEIKFIRQNLIDVKKAFSIRGETYDIDSFINCDDKRRKILLDIESLRNKRNVVSEKISQMEKDDVQREGLIIETRDVSNEIKLLEKSLSEAEDELNQILLRLPNIPHASTPIGKDSSQNPVIKQNGQIPKFDFKPKAHEILGENLKILDLDRAARITGARFPLYFGKGAYLERALINFMIDIHTKEHGYKEVLPPYMVNRTSMTNTGQLPKFEKELFKLEGWDYYMIPTAEVPVTNIHQNEVLDDGILPVLYTAYTPCFRSEAGSYGKDTRGLIRQHQFDKVELVKFCAPEKSYEELEKLLSDAESILQKLNLPYQVIALCSGDLGFASAKTYDIEVWMPSQNIYREISSCSNFESFQARRANIRFKRKGKKGTELVHTLNGSGLAVGRTFAAILENNQQADGSVVVPEALRPYMGGLEIITREN